jgi:hypothetical protein
VNNEAPREKVVRQRGAVFAFSLPEGHTLDILDKPEEGTRRVLAYIGVPGGGGETCYVEIVARDEEIEYVLEPTGAKHSVGGQPVGYPWPRVQNEHDRLRAAWEASGGDVTRFDAWARGEALDARFERARAELRRLREGWWRSDGDAGREWVLELRPLRGGSC